MKEELVTFETAKLAKEKRFNWNCFYAFGKAGEDATSMLKYFAEFHPNNLITGDNFNFYKGIYRNISAPTQSLLQKWLLETHNIDIELTFDDGQWFVYVGEFSYPDSSLKITATIECTDFKDAIKQKPIALEKGLQEALKLIKL